MLRRLSKSKSPFVTEKTEAHVVKEFQPETETPSYKKKKVRDLRKDREHIYSFCLDEIIWL